MKEGAFVPTVSRIKNVAEYGTKGQFLLNYFPSTTKTDFTWFEDDGRSKNSLAAKKYTLIKCSGQDQGKKIVVHINPSNKLFFPSHLATSITLAQKPSSVVLNGKRIPVVSNVSETNASNPFALWMPGIFAIQIYTQSLTFSSLEIEVTK